MTLGQGQEMTLAFINYLPSLTPLVVCIEQLPGLKYRNYENCQNNQCSNVNMAKPVHRRVG